jgi:hypothetical protein
MDLRWARPSRGACDDASFPNRQPTAATRRTDETATAALQQLPGLDR